MSPNNSRAKELSPTTLMSRSPWASRSSTAAHIPASVATGRGVRTGQPTPGPERLLASGQRTGVVGWWHAPRPLVHACKRAGRGTYSTTVTAAGATRVPGRGRLRRGPAACGPPLQQQRGPPARQAGWQGRVASCGWAPPGVLLSFPFLPALLTAVGL